MDSSKRSLTKRENKKHIFTFRFLCFARRIYLLLTNKKYLSNNNKTSVDDETILEGDPERWKMVVVK